jgi:sugar lactone lactonase YvrE
LADSNLNSSISALVSDLQNQIATASVTELLLITRAAKAIGHTENTAIEIAVNTRVNQLTSTATADELEKLARAVDNLTDTASAPAATTSISDHTDVDTTTTPPTDGQALIWDNSTALWKPEDVASDSYTDILPDTTATYDLGSPSKTWVDVYAANIKGLDAPVNDTDAARKKYVDDLFASAVITVNSVNGYQGSVLLTTDDVDEGIYNLYYDDTKVDSHLNQSSATNNQILSWNGTDYTWIDNSSLSTVSGNIIPDTTETYDLGSATNKFRDLYLSGNSITLGTIELSDNGGALEVTSTGGGSTESFATETYVTNQVNNLIDAAPGTLDTLNELAAALGDDANFSTTITNSLANKADTSSLATVATSGSYNDLSNTPTIPTNNNQLTNGAGFITAADVSGGNVVEYTSTNTAATNDIVMLNSDGTVTVVEPTNYPFDQQTAIDTQMTSGYIGDLNYRGMIAQHSTREKGMLIFPGGTGHNDRTMLVVFSRNGSGISKGTAFSSGEPINNFKDQHAFFGPAGAHEDKFLYLGASASGGNLNVGTGNITGTTVNTTGTDSSSAYSDATNNGQLDIGIGGGGAGAMAIDHGGFSGTVLTLYLKFIGVNGYPAVRKFTYDFANQYLDRSFPEIELSTSEAFEWEHTAIDPSTPTRIALYRQEGSTSTRRGIIKFADVDWDAGTINIGPAADLFTRSGSHNVDAYEIQNKQAFHPTNGLLAAVTTSPADGGGDAPYRLKVALYSADANLSITNVSGNLTLMSGANVRVGTVSGNIAWTKGSNTGSTPNAPILITPIISNQTGSSPQTRYLQYDNSGNYIAQTTDSNTFDSGSMWTYSSPFNDGDTASYSPDTVNSQYPQVIMTQGPYGESNFDATKLHGVAASAGTTIDVTLEHGIHTGLSGLTTGTKYFVTDSGGISTSGSAKLGTAINATSLALDFTDELTSADLGTYATKSYVATQTFSGSYNDLTNQPTIPTNNNQLTNGAGYVTSAQLDGDNTVVSYSSTSSASANDVMMLNTDGTVTPIEVTTFPTTGVDGNAPQIVPSSTRLAGSTNDGSVVGDAPNHLFKLDGNKYLSVGRHEGGASNFYGVYSAVAEYNSAGSGSWTWGTVYDMNNTNWGTVNWNSEYYNDPYVLRSPDNPDKFLFFKLRTGGSFAAIIGTVNGLTISWSDYSQPSQNYPSSINNSYNVKTEYDYAGSSAGNYKFIVWYGTASDMKAFRVVWDGDTTITWEDEVTISTGGIGSVPNGNINPVSASFSRVTEGRLCVHNYTTGSLQVYDIDWVNGTTQVGNNFSITASSSTDGTSNYYGVDVKTAWNPLTDEVISINRLASGTPNIRFRRYSVDATRTITANGAEFSPHGFYSSNTYWLNGDFKFFPKSNVMFFSHARKDGGYDMNAIHYLSTDNASSFTQYSGHFTNYYPFGPTLNWPFSARMYSDPFSSGQGSMSYTDRSSGVSRLEGNPLQGEYVESNLDKSKIHGLAATSGTTPDVTTQFGVHSGLSGLTVGSKYYVLDDGTLSTTPDTHNAKIGVAVKSTHIALDFIDELTESDLTTYATKSYVATQTFSGSYNDLTNQPTIPANTSQLANNSGFITAADVPNANVVEYTSTTAASVDDVIMLNSDGTVTPVAVTTTALNTNVAELNPAGGAGSNFNKWFSGHYPSDPLKVFHIYRTGSSWYSQIIEDNTYWSTHSFSGGDSGQQSYPFVSPVDESKVLWIGRDTGSAGAQTFTAHLFSVDASKNITSTSTTHDIVPEMEAITNSDGETWGSTTTISGEVKIIYDYAHSSTGSYFFNIFYEKDDIYCIRVEWDGVNAPTFGSVISVANKFNNRDCSRIKLDPNNLGRWLVTDYSGYIRVYDTDYANGTSSLTATYLNNSVDNTLNVHHADWNPKVPDQIFSLYSDAGGLKTNYAQYTISGSSITLIRSNYLHIAYHSNNYKTSHVQFFPNSDHMVMNYNSSSTRNSMIIQAPTTNTGGSGPTHSKVLEGISSSWPTEMVSFDYTSASLHGSLYYPNGSNSALRFIRAGFTASNFDSNKLHGLAASAGTTIDVTLEHGIHTGLSGLTTGSAYYTNDEGVISTTVGGGSKIGTAINATSLALDFTDELVSADLATYATKAYVASQVPSLTGYATETYVNTSVANLVDSAPATLDTLNELAAALGDDANFSTTITNQIAAKADAYSTVSVTTSSGKFYIDGEQQSIATLQPGRTYRFDQSAASNNSHPLRFSEVEDGTHAGGGATEYTTGVTVNGTAGNAGAYVEIAVTNATPRLYYYCANHTGMGGKVSVGKELFVERITSDTWITGPIQTTSVNVGTGGQINAALATLDFTNTTVNFSGATIAGLSNSDVGLANIADNAQGVVVTGKVAAGSLDLGTGGSINAQLGTLDFTHTTVNFSGANVGGLGDTIQDEVDFHLNKDNSAGQTIISDGQVLSWNSTGGLQGTGDYEWIASATGGSVEISATAPSSPSHGDMWFDSTNLLMYIYYTDSGSSQWVQTSGFSSTSTSDLDVSDLTDTTNLLFDGQYSSLTGAPTSSTAGALGTLTKTFTQNEEAEITLSETISPVPNVSVFKEVPQGGLTSKGNWDVNANATNYEFFDEKPISYTSTTLTPSATGDGTFTSSNPTVVGYDISGISSVGDYETATPVSQVPSPPPNGYTLADFVISPDGTKIIIVSAQRMHEFTMSTAYDITSASWTQRYDYDAYNPSTWGGYGFFELGDSGSKLYMADWSNHKIDQFTLSTPYSLGNGASDVSFSGQVTGMNNSGSNQTQNGMYVKDSTTVFIMKDDVSGNQAIIEEWIMSTAWDITTLSYNNKTKSITGQRGTDMTFSSDGLTMFISDVFGSGTLKYFSLGTAWDISTINTTGTTFTNPALTNSTPQAINFSKSGTKLYMADGTKIYEQDTGYGEVFSSTDVGKRVVGNSGSTIITSTAGAYKSVTAFADTSAISSWQLFGTEGKADGSGIELSGFQNGYDIANASYDNVSFSLQAQDSASAPQNTFTGPKSLRFNNDGTKMYFVAGNSLDHIFEYDLSTAWDLSSASYNNSNLVVTSQTSQPAGIEFSSDGTKLFLIDTDQDKIWKYNLSTAWDLSSASYSNNQTPGDILRNLDSKPGGLVINSDGTKILWLGMSNERVYQMTLSTAYDLSTASMDTKLNGLDAAYVDVSAHGTSMTDINISSDGKKLFLVNGYGTTGIFQYDLANPYEINDGSTNSNQGTASYNNISFSFPQDGRPSSVAFDTLGTKMYAVGLDNDTVYQYSTGEVATPYSQYFPALTTTGGQINSSSWADLDSMVADETKNDGDVFYAVSTDDRTSWGVIKDGDGVRKIARNNSGTWQYNNDAGTSVNISYDIANAVSDSVSYTPSNPAFSSVMAYTFNSDGTKLYSVVQGSPWQHELSTAFDISTASSIGYNYTADIQESNARFVTFNPAGTKMYLGGVVNNTIYQYSLTGAFDLSGSSVSRDTSKTFTITNNSPGTASVSLNGMIFNNDGTKMYITNSDRIEQYSLSTAYDISTASYDSINVVVATGDFPTDTKFNSDGTKLFIIGSVTDSVHQYSLSTAYDLSTISYDSISFSVSGTISNPRSLNFNNDGSKMYISHLSGGAIYQYTTSGTQIVYDTSETWVDGTNNNEHATLQEALGAQSFNRMDKAQLQAVTDPNHYVLGDTLDLMIAPYAASGTSPLSDGVTIGYQADALIKQAINGTDYEAEFPATNKVKIKSLAAQNLKIRII